MIKISASKLNCALDCPYKYFYKYILKESKRWFAGINEYTVVGNVTHKLIEDFNRIAYNDRVGLKKNSINFLQTYKGVLNRKIDDKIRNIMFEDFGSEEFRFYNRYREEKNIDKMIKFNINNFIDFAIRLSKLKDGNYNKFSYIIPLSDDGFPATEIYLDRKFKNVSHEFIVNGYVDLVSKHKNKIYIIDYKTSNNCSFENPKPEYVRQLVIYKYLTDHIYPDLERETGLLYTKSGEYQKVEFDHVTSNAVWRYCMWLCDLHEAIKDSKTIEEMNVEYKENILSSPKHVNMKHEQNCYWCDYNKICGIR